MRYKIRSEACYDSDKNSYFKYTVTVSSLESEYSIPDVRVVDSFTNKGKFIEEYCGINGTENTPDGFKQVETSNKNSSPGTL